MTQGNILVVSSPQLTPGLRGQMEGVMKKAQIPTMQVRLVQDLTVGLQIKVGKRKHVADPTKAGVFHERMRAAIKRYMPRVIVVNDWVTLAYITGKHSSLDKTRGSLYWYDGIPCIVTDSMRTEAGGAKFAAVPYAAWLMLQDFKKVKRWFAGAPRKESEFEFIYANTIDAVAALWADTQNAILCSMDVETKGSGTSASIVVSGYSLLMPDGRIKTYTVPFCEFPDYVLAWSDEDFRQVHALLTKVHSSSVPKVLQNGSYDCCYYLRHRLPVSNFYYDTAVAFHSIWPELPKDLAFITSIASDWYTFWKDEGKTGEKEDAKASKLPRTKEQWESYIRYNGKDCHNTLVSLLWILPILRQTPWALDNYRKSIRLILGPAIAMMMRGVRVNRNLQNAMQHRDLEESFKALQDLQRMVANPAFNPNAPQQVAQLVYDVYKLVPLKKRGQKTQSRSTDEKELEILRTQHPVVSRIIQQIWNTKKPANNAAKYGSDGLRLMNGRWFYTMNPVGTDTGRFASKKSNFWIGQQIQNVPYPMRALVEPDPGFVLFERDYSRADFWHTAMASGDAKMMEMATSREIDVHCYHASRFFSRPYDEIYKGYKAKEPWVVDSLHGVRQNAKRIAYGANYLMTGFTLFIQMGLDAVRATAQFMGKDTRDWGFSEYTNFCQGLLDFYFSDMYPGVLTWLERELIQAQRNGNRVVCSGGRTRTFFADLLRDKAAKRQFAAYFGQGGTAGTINAAIDKFFYSGLDSENCQLLFQVHDAIIGQVRESRLDLVDEIGDVMAIENEMNGRRFIIPSDASVGYGWGFRMTEYRPGITLQEIRAADKKWHEKEGFEYAA